MVDGCLSILQQATLEVRGAGKEGKPDVRADPEVFARMLGRVRVLQVSLALCS